MKLSLMVKGSSGWDIKKNQIQVLKETNYYNFVTQ